MKNRVCEQFRKVLTQVLAPLIFFCLFLIPDSFASQEAIVIAERAVIYSDYQMSSTVGYVKRGRRVTLGEVARNNSQVYPIIVSGKIAYIKTEDVSLELEDTTVELERFKNQTKVNYTTKYTAAFISYASKVTMDSSGNTGGIQDESDFNFLGVGLKGEAYLKYLFDLQILVNYLTGTGDEETIRMVEAGLGAGFRLVDFSRFKVTGEVQVLGIPYSSYSYKDQFRVNGYGFTAGASGTAYMRLTETFGLEGSLGAYYTKLSGFRAPKPYKNMSPGFIGTRLYLGGTYSF